MVGAAGRSCFGCSLTTLAQRSARAGLKGLRRAWVFPLFVDLLMRRRSFSIPAAGRRQGAAITFASVEEAHQETAAAAASGGRHAAGAHRRPCCEARPSSRTTCSLRPEEDARGASSPGSWAASGDPPHWPVLVLCRRATAPLPPEPSINARLPAAARLAGPCTPRPPRASLRAPRSSSPSECSLL